MRRLYLIRHAMPDMPPGERLCLGSADIPLGPVGHMQGVLLAEAMKSRPVTAVFTSDLRRAIQTASYLNDSPVILPGLREMDAGLWDGLTFSEIRRRWPDIYAIRGTDPNYPIPGSEDPMLGQQRFLAAVRQALNQSSGDIAIVAHATVNQSLMCHVLGTPLSDSRRYRTGYTAITTLGVENGTLTLLSPTELPRIPLTDSLCLSLLAAVGTPEQVIAHCRTVAARAEELANAIPLPLNRTLIRHAALLHDIARVYPDHAALGAQWLRELGYPEIARIIACHHDLEGSDITEAAIVWLADKLPIAERFAASRLKCATPEAVSAHERRYQIALNLKQKINTLCGKEVVI